MVRNFICPRVIGGLGNQLFVLMAAYALAKDENAELVIDPRNYAASPIRKVNTYWDTFLRPLKPYIQYGKKPKVDSVVKEEIGFVYNRLIRKEKNRTCLKGYFQSYKYFDKYRRDIQSLFKLNNEIYTYLKGKYEWFVINNNNITAVINEIKERAKEVENEIKEEGNEVENEIKEEKVENKILRVAIHVRRGDYITKNHNVLPLNYYKKCLDSIHDKLMKETNIIFAIFSDCCTYVETDLSPLIYSYKTDSNQIFNVITMKDEEDYIELHMLQYFDIYFIANSTFSWWGAYLNRNPNVEVYIPYQWMCLNQLCPPELVLPGWKLIHYLDELT